MKQWQPFFSLAILALSLHGFIAGTAWAQEHRTLTDFRERTGYTSDELGAALFPVMSTRGVLVRPAQAPPASMLRPAAVVVPVFFAVNSAEVLSRYYPELDKLGAQLTAPHYQNYQVTIEGHTDNRGPVRLNQRLSEQRAVSVKQYLVQRFSINAERLATQGYGPQKPLAPNTTEAGRQKNRRIEIANVVQ